MVGKNRYFRFAKISEARFRSLLRCFALDLTATQTAALAGLSVRRTICSSVCASAWPPSAQKSLLSKANWRPTSRTSVHGVCVAGEAVERQAKTIVFGLLKRGDQVYNGDRAQCLQSRSAGGHPYRQMARLRRAGRSGLREAPRVNHGDNQFALGPNHINGIESFWSYTKARLAKFHGLRRETFPPASEGN